MVVPDATSLSYGYHCPHRPSGLWPQRSRYSPRMVSDQLKMTGDTSPEYPSRLTTAPRAALPALGDGRTSARSGNDHQVDESDRFVAVAPALSSRSPSLSWGPATGTRRLQVRRGDPGDNAPIVTTEAPGDVSIPSQSDRGSLAALWSGPVAARGSYRL